LGHKKKLNFFERWNFMTEQNNRVLARRGSRNLTEEEVSQVSGNYGTPILFTEQLTNLGRDHVPDQEAA
jgi:hypothetical protein